MYNINDANFKCLLCSKHIPLRLSQKGEWYIIVTEDYSTSFPVAKRPPAPRWKQICLEARGFDHLVSTLVTDVVPYYAFKQRRQDLGFEGPDAEAKKRTTIVERSKDYTLDDIQQVCESRYTISSKSDPSVSYDIDLEAYTCSCLDFPLISFCKHICAVQDLFDVDRLPENHTYQSESSRPALELPTFSSLQAPSPPAPAGNPLKARGLTDLTEKLQRLAARLRRPSRKGQEATFRNLENAVDALLLETENHSVLPTSTFVAPNDKSSWDQTQGSMLPGVKNKKRRLGDDTAYSGGTSSGLKVRNKAKKSSKTAPAPAPTPTQPALPPAAPASSHAPTTYPQYIYPPPIYHPYPPTVPGVPSQPNPPYYYPPYYPIYHGPPRST